MSKVEVKPRRILVIGGAGYIGSSLVPKLLSQGYRVRLLDSCTFGTAPLAEVITDRNLELIRGDFRDINAVVTTMRGVNAVIHLGALVGDPAAVIDEAAIIESNRIVTRLVAGCAKANRIPRFIFASSCSVYGGMNQIFDEQCSLNPISLYARSKAASEAILTGLASKAFRPTILRFGTVYGLAGRTRFDLVINLLAAKAILDKQVTVFGADEVKPFVHVEDVANAMIKVLEAPLEHSGGEIFNVGSEAQSMSLSEIGEIIRKQAPKADLQIGCKGGDTQALRFDFSKIQNRLGFRAEWTIERGIRQVIDSIKSGQVEDLNDPKYTQSKFLTEDLNLELSKQEPQVAKATSSQPLLY